MYSETYRETKTSNSSRWFMFMLLSLFFFLVLISLTTCRLLPKVTVIETYENDPSVVEEQGGVEKVGNGGGEPEPGEKVTIGDLVMKPNGDKAVAATKKKDPKGKDKVVKQKSDLDGEYYYVSASLPDRKRAANMLSEVNRKAQTLLQAIDEQLDGNKRIKADDENGKTKDITDDLRRLVRKHYKKTVPMAEYHNPKDRTVGSNSDKGMLIEVCLRNKYNTNEWNPENTLYRVIVHELTHSSEDEYRGDGDAAHGPDFRRIMSYLLKVSENLGLYSCKEYKSSKRVYCGLGLTEVDLDCY